MINYIIVVTVSLKSKIYVFNKFNKKILLYYIMTKIYIYLNCLLFYIIRIYKKNKIKLFFVKMLKLYRNFKKECNDLFNKLLIKSEFFLVITVKKKKLIK